MSRFYDKKMDNLKIFTEKDPAVLREMASGGLEKILKANTRNKVLLLLSGGSAFSLLTVNRESLGPHLTIGVLDERYSRNPGINNYDQLSSTAFFEDAEKAGCIFMDTSVQDDDSLKDFAGRFEKTLREWKIKNPTGLIVITQGMGPDGHTSGIMPYPENEQLFETMFNREDRWIAGYDAGNKNPYPLRATTTIPFLKTVDFSVMYVSGSEKAGAINKALKGSLPYHVLPASIIRQMKNVILYTDIEIT